MAVKDEAIYVRIRAPRNKNEDTPRSFNSGGIKIIQGGTGKLVKDETLISKLKKALGDRVEFSKKPFAAETPGPKPNNVIEPGKE